MVYVNVDPGNGRFNSSSANLTIPAGAHVVKAFLYWAADLSRGVVNGQRNEPAAPAPDGDTPEGQAGTHGRQAAQDQRPVRDRAAPRRHGRGLHHDQRVYQTRPKARWDSVSSWYSTAPSACNPEGGSPGWAYQVRADVTDHDQRVLARKVGVGEQR